MEQSTKVQVRKFEQLVKRFDKIVAQLADLKTKMSSLASKDSVAKVKNKLEEMTELDRRIRELEKQQTSLSVEINSTLDLLHQLPTPDDYKSMKATIDSIPQRVEASIGEASAQILDKLLEQIRSDLQMQASRQSKTEMEIQEIRSMLTANSAQMGDMDQSLTNLNVIAMDLAASQKTKNQLKQEERDKASLEELKVAHKETKGILRDLTRQMDRISSWVKNQTFGPDLDKLSSNVGMLTQKFETIEGSTLQLSQASVQKDELESQLGLIKSELNRLQEATGQLESRDVLNGKFNKVDREMEKLNSDLIWGVQEIRQRIDSLLLGIRKELLEEDKKRYEKFLKLEVEHQKQMRIANALYGEISEIKKQLPGDSARGKSESKPALAE